VRKIQFTQIALDDLKSFKAGNQNLVFKIFELISDIQKTPFEGLGKPEPLKYENKGLWSRRINDEHRLIYLITDDLIEIKSCSGHYD